MPLPTLALKGKLQPYDEDPAKKLELDEWVPVEYVIDWFRQRQSKTGITNRVLILKSETASGKSTMFPPELYIALVRGNTDRRGIICTQPRVMTAIENVNEMLKHYNKQMRLGEQIGWSTKHNKLRPTDVGLLSATIGTLTQQLRTLTDDEIMAKYKFILIDETHERDLQTDMTIYMLKNLMLRQQDNPHCPFVVLMSATFEPQSFLDYFDVSIKTNFIWCVGETAGFTENWEWNEGRTVNDYPRAAASVTERIIGENPNDDPTKADILIFMPGAAEFAMTEQWLNKLNTTLAAKDPKLVFSLLQINSDAVGTRNIDYVRTMYIPVSEHIVRVGHAEYVPSRRVIITTNVAETGLTLDNLKYVIDAGFNREIEYNPVHSIRGLITKPAPWSRIKQRKGRAGRKFPGVFYPLYPRYIYDKLPRLQFPQILIEDVSVIAMDIISEQLRAKTMRGEREPEFLIGDIDMIDIPTPDSLHACMEKLYTLGFIRPGSIGAVLTPLGELALKFPMMRLEIVRMILGAYFWGVAPLDIIGVAAWLSIDTKSIIGQATDEEIDAKKKVEIRWDLIYKQAGANAKTRLLIADDFIDGIIFYNAMQRVVASKLNLRDWCDKVRVSYRACLDFIRARDEIIDMMLGNEMYIRFNDPTSLARAADADFMTSCTRIKYCIYDGFRNQIVVRRNGKLITGTGLECVEPVILQDSTISVKPNYILASSIGLKYNKNTSMYDVITDRICTLDGFISPDQLFAV